MRPRTKLLLRFRRLENLRVGLRLRLVFTCVLLIMLAGSLASVWFLQGLRDRTRKIAKAEQRVTAVVRINNGLLILMSRLHRAADSERAEFFEAQATGLLAAFRSNNATAMQTLQEISPPSGRERIVVDSFNQMLAELPDRIATLKQLARAQDWTALHARLTDQVDHTDDVAEALVREADAGLTQAQGDLSREITDVERRSMVSLAIGGVFALLAAALLGMLVTRSITEPLGRLNEGARALAQGEFQHRVALTGSNELSNLGQAFDHTAKELARLYAQVRRSEARFRSLIENGSDLILVVGASGSVVYASPSAQRILGCAPEALAGCALGDLLDSGDADSGRQMLDEKRLQPGASAPFELHFRRPGGALRLVAGIATNLREEPAVGGVLFNGRDVTESRNAERALRRSEQHLRLIADSLPVLISYVDREHRYVFSNLHHEQWFNRRRRELTGARMEDVMGDEAYRSFQESVDKALEGSTVTYEAALWHEGIGERHVRTILVPDFDENNAVRGFVSLMEDITADKQTEAALRASEERLQELLARENEGRAAAELLNQIGRILSAELDEVRLSHALAGISTQLAGAQFGGLFLTAGGQPQLAAYSGASRETVERLSLLSSTDLWPHSGAQIVRSKNLQEHPAYAERIAPLDAEKGYAPVASYFAVAIVSRTQDVLGILAFGHASPNRFPQATEDVIAAVGTQAAIALDNATLFKRLNSANDALRKSNEALQQANEDLNVFAFSASHDLQEPLRNVSLYSQLLRRRLAGQLDFETNEFIGYLVQGAARMSDLIRDLLTFMQASNIHADGVASNLVSIGVKKAMLALTNAIAASGATITCGSLPEIAMEPIHIQQLFQNLIGNAIKYRSNKRPEIHISASDCGEFWEFSVRDNGLGIDPKYQTQIFKPFKRLHSRTTHPGTGIGLAICQKIVDRYGGRIWIESEPGRGSNFKFTIPKTPASRMEI